MAAVQHALGHWARACKLASTVSVIVMYITQHPTDSQGPRPTNLRHVAGVAAQLGTPDDE